MTRSPTLRSGLAESSTLTDDPGLSRALKSVSVTEFLGSCLLYFDPDFSAAEITTVSEMTVGPVSLSVENALGLLIS